MTARKIIVCIDGTGNEVGDRETNVLKLFKALRQDDTQIARYGMGVGTYDGPQFLGRTRQVISGVFGLAFGLGLEDDVLEAYRFLCRTYRAGDRIYLFGFSRGAYAARVLAGFIHNFGLVSEGVLHLITPVFRAYRRVTDFDAGADPNHVFQALREYDRVLDPYDAPIRALGLFDTVSSIVRLSRPWRSFRKWQSPAELGTHAGVDSNVSVRIVLHALAVDERRSMFRPQFWAPSGGDCETVDGQTRPLYFGNNFRHESLKRDQIVRQRWFPGFHSDVGGSPAEDRSGLGKITLLWMLDALEAAEKQADAEDAKAAGEAPAPPPPPGLTLKRGARSRYLLGEVADARTPGGLAYAPPAADAPMHNSIFTRGARPASSWFWIALELLPKSLKRRAPGPPAWYRRGWLIWWYLPLFEPRFVPPDHETDASVHDRITGTGDYRPPNVPHGA